jgi:hypothetical protein
LVGYTVIKEEFHAYTQDTDTGTDTQTGKTECTERNRNRNGRGTDSTVSPHYTLARHTSEHFALGDGRLLEWQRSGGVLGNPAQT